MRHVNEDGITQTREDSRIRNTVGLHRGVCASSCPPGVCESYHDNIAPEKGGSSMLRYMIGRKNMHRQQNASKFYKRTTDLGATKAWAPAAQATAIIADFIFTALGVFVVEMVSVLRETTTTTKCYACMALHRYLRSLPSVVSLPPYT